MYMTLGEAAKQTGKSKSTISKYIKDGSLSVIEKTDKGYKLDASEVFRVFPTSVREPVQNSQIEQTRTPSNLVNEHLKIRELEMQLEYMQDKLRWKDEMINEKNQQLEQSQQNTEKWQSMAEKSQHLLNYTQEQLQKTTEKPVQRQKRFLGIIPY